MLTTKNKVVVYDNFKEYYLGKDRNIIQNLDNPLFKVIEADILDYETLLKSMIHVDIVIHLAAQPGVRYSMLNPEKTIKNNVLGTLNVLKAAKEAGIKRVVFSSSSSVYGAPNYLPTDEEHPTNPISIYGASKLMAEKLSNIFYNQSGLPVVILRYFSVYGPRQRHDMAIYKWAKAVFEGKPITIYGDGNQTRDFTYISDIVEGTIRVGHIKGVEGAIFNIGGGSRISINETVKMLIDRCRASNAKIKYESTKVGDVEDTHADITKASKLLGYKPKVKLEEGLKLFVNWYKQNSVK